MEFVDRILSTWQVRALRAAQGIEGAVLLSMLAHAYDDDQIIGIMLAAFGQSAIKAPFICSAAKIDKAGRVCVDVAFDTHIRKLKPIFASEIIFRDHLRRLADRLKLADDERTELFALARKWVVCDYRLDPTMARNDPDAKRLTHGVTKLAH